MRELEASVNAERDQNNTENGSGDGARPQMASVKALKLQIFLKEKGKMTLKEMSLAAATYIDAHGYQSNVNHGAENKAALTCEIKLK